MNNSINFITEYIINNKEQIIKEVNDGQYVNYIRTIRNLPKIIQDEPSISDIELSPIVKELLGFNNMSSLSTGYGVERTDMLGNNINYFTCKVLLIVRLKK